MKTTISLGSNQLSLEPQTEFEKEFLRKFFEPVDGEELNVSFHYTNAILSINFCERTRRNA